MLGTVKFRVPEAIQRNKKVKGSRQPPVHRSARTVEQEVKALPIRLQPPHRRAAAGGALPVVELWVVEARELNPPAGEEALVWVLLTTLPVTNFEQAAEMLELYLCRWEIELLHRVVKSGCKVEQIQQRFDFRIKPVIVLYLIVAWRLLYVMRLGRACPDLPGDGVRRQRMAAGRGGAQRPGRTRAQAHAGRNGAHGGGTGRLCPTQKRSAAGHEEHVDRIHARRRFCAVLGMLRSSGRRHRLARRAAQVHAPWHAPATRRPRRLERRHARRAPGWPALARRAP